MSYGVIYELFCITSGLRYVGQTTMSLDERWQGHCKLAREGVMWRLSQAIREHTEDAFVRRTLCECNSQQELNEAEKRWMIELNTMWPHGYNMRNGSQYTDAMTRVLISERTSAAMRRPEVHAKLRHTANRRRGVSHPMFGQSGPMFGRNHTPEAREKMRQAALEREARRRHV